MLPSWKNRHKLSTQRYFLGFHRDWGGRSTSQAAWGRPKSTVLSVAKGPSSSRLPGALASQHQHSELLCPHVSSQLLPIQWEGAMVAAKGPPAQSFLQLKSAYILLSGHLASEGLLLIPA